MQLAGKNIVVVGLGRSGVAVARACAARGANVIATDQLARQKLSQEALNLEHLQPNSVQLLVGGHEQVAWKAADLIVMSPGVPRLEAIEEAEAGGVQVIGELELSCRLVRAPIAVVGGTNGKSTVTTWLGMMMASLGNVVVGGNLGIPLAAMLDQPIDAVVLEISSFQAERVPTLHPRAAALLNITQDHLDRYSSFNAYAEAKGNVFVNMQPSDVAVIPHNDALCAKQAARGKSSVVTFGDGGDVRSQNGFIIDSVHGWKFDAATIQVPGHHNILNACAAIAMAGAMGANERAVQQALREFTGLEHRMQVVGRIGNVVFYNDSKGTNVGATVVALQGLCEPKAVLIAGGRDKQGDYEPLVEALEKKARAVVLIGEAAERMHQAIGGRVETIRAATMNEAVRKAYDAAKQDDAVVLSPACSSYDMFKDYLQRGEVFCQCVRNLHEIESKSNKEAP